MQMRIPKSMYVVLLNRGLARHRPKLSLLASTLLVSCCMLGFAPVSVAMADSLPTSTITDGLMVNIPASMSVCEGATLDVSAGSVSVSGGTPPYTYQWLLSGSAVGSPSSNPALSIAAPPLGIHTYTLQVSDMAGNTGSDQIVVTTLCQPHVAINNPPPLCVNTPTTISTVVVSSSSMLSYQWYANGNAIAGATAQSLNLSNPPVGNTVYSVVVTEAGGCTDSDNAILTVYPNLDVAIPAPSGCVGEPVELVPTISNGMQPYTYQWLQNGNPISGATSSTYTIASAASGSFTYGVQVTDNNGCPGSANVTFSVGNPPTVNVPNPMPVCSGNSVSLAASVSGAGASPTYQWYVGNTLIPGANAVTYNIAAPLVGNSTYSVVVTGSNGCQRSDEATVTVYPNPSVNLPDPATACTGGSATLTAVVSGGAIPYTYQWQNNGASVSGSTNSLNVATPTTGSNIYMVSVTDANGCHATDNATVSATVGISVSIPNVSVCENLSLLTINGSTGTIIGGTAPYTYQWYFAGAPIAGATSLTLTRPMPAAGIYTYILQVTDANNCTGADEVTVAVNPRPTITLSQPGATCVGEPIEITSIIVCGSQPVYQWFRNNTPIAGQNSPTLYLTNVPAGIHTFTLQVTSENTCMGEADVVVTVYAPPTLSLNSTGGNCAGEMATVSVMALGGSSPYTYQWYANGSIITGATNASYNISSANAGNNVYTVLVSDSHQCSSTGSVTVETGNPPTVSLNTPPEVCAGNPITLSGTVSGGTMPYTYQWYAGSNPISGANNTSYTATNPPVGTTNYTLQVTDSNGCIDERTVVATVNPNPNVNAPDVGACSAASVLLTSTTTGGSPGYSYQWYMGANSVTGGNTANVSVNAPASGTTTYMVSVSDSNGCTDTDNAIVSSTNIAVSIPNPSSVCYGTSVTIGNATISGGSLPYTFQWSENGTPIAGATSVTLNLAAPSVGTHTYTLTVNDGTGCSGSASATLTVNPSPIVAVASPAPQCQGSGVVMLTAVVSGAPSVSYQWHTGGSPIAGATNATYTISNPIAGTTAYSVVVTATGNCTASAACNVVIYPRPTANITASGGSCSGDATVLSANATGGTPSYTYQWYLSGSPIAGATNATYSIATLSGTSAYSVVVSDANGCTGSDDINLSAATPPMVNVPNPPTACAGNSVTLQGSPSGGLAPYTYQWYTGGMPIGGATNNTYTIGNPIAGSQTYILIITDQNGCTAQDDATVTTYPAVNFNLSAPTGVCLGAEVIIAANVTNGTSPYTYQWTHNGSPIVSANGAEYSTSTMTVGTHTYTLTVTDINGCSKTKSATITVGTPPTITAPNPAPLCASTSVILSSTVTGGAGGFTYQWYLGGTPVSGGAAQSITISNPPTGNTTYTVIVTDSNGCTASDNATITVSGTMALNLPPPATLCVGSSTTLNVNVSGGSPTYSYQWWLNGNSISGAVAQSYTVNTPPVGSYTYTVQVMDSNGCMGEVSAVVQVVSQPSVSIAPIAPLCGSSPVSLTANISNGAGLPIQWQANGNAIAGATSATLNIPSPAVGNTTYSVSVGAGSTCSAVATTTVSVYPIPVVAVTCSAAAVCAGTPVLVTAVVNSGTPNYTYQWTNNGVPMATTTASFNANTAMAGTQVYNVTVTDAHGCTSSASTTVNVVTQPTVNIAPIAAQCGGSPVSLTANISNGAGLPIQWYANGNIISGATSATLNIPNPSNGTTMYSISVGAGSTCAANDEVAVTVYPTPTVSIAPVPSACEGSAVTISANANGGSGSGYTYQWTHNGAAAGSGSSLTPSGLASGSHTYAVTVTDDNGCTASASTTFAINAQPVINIAPVSPICAGTPLTLTATTNGSWSIQWFLDGSPIAGATSTTLNIAAPASGSHVYSATAGGGAACSDNAQVTVTVYPTPTASIAPVPSACEGSAVTISANANGGSGSGYTYQWTHNGAAAGSGAVLVLTGLSVGSHTYAVTVTDSNGCTASAMTTSSITAQPTVSISDPAPICYGTEAVTLTASVSGASVSYQWYVGGSAISGATNSSYTVSNPAVGTHTYSVQVMSSAGCIASDATNLTVYPTPSVLVNNANAVCAGSMATLSGTASGGTAPYSYQWYVGGSAISGATNSSYTANSPAVGTTIYTLVVTDANGCTTQDDGSIIVNPSLGIVIPSISALCQGSQAITTATVSGGTAPFSYQWHEGSMPLSGQTTATLSIVPSVGTTVYTLVVTDVAGCSGTETVSVTSYQQPSVMIEGTSLLCGNGCAEASLTAVVSPAVPNPNGNYIYVWSNGATTPSISVLPGSTATYSVTVSIAGLSGCAASDSHTITVSSLSVNLNDAAICEGQAATLTPSVSGATGALIYSWSNGAVGASISVSPMVTTPYAVSVTDASGCTGFDSGLVAVSRIVQADAGADLITCAGASNTTLGSSAIAGASYSWSNGQNTSSISVSPTTTTTYTLTVTNACGASTDQATVVVGSTQADAGGDQMLCAGGSTTLTATGGTQYTWSNGQNGQSISVSPTTTTTYTVTVSDANGCSDTDAVTVTVNSLSAAGAVSIAAVCEGGSTAECVTLNAIADADNIISYVWSTGDTEPTISVSGGGNGTYSVTITDAFGCTASASIDDPCGTPPAPVDAIDDQATTPEDVAVLINVLGNDEGDNIFITALTNPSNGTVIIQGNQVQYTPNPGFTGIDVFTYQICNASGACDIATVTVVVTGGTPPPPCENISYYCTYPITPLQICPEFCALNGDYTITDATATYLCSISVQDNGTCVRYIALPLFNGVDTVQIYATDQWGNIDVATIVIQVGDCDTWNPDGGIVAGNPNNTVTPAGGKHPYNPFVGGSGSHKVMPATNAQVSTDGWQLSLSPVPATDVLNLRFIGNDSPISVEVFDLAGVVVLRQSIDAGKGLNLYRFNVASLPAGAYLLRLSDSHTTTSVKLVKQ